jgi:hypothetical protein
MARVTFVTGSKGGVGRLQHREDIPKQMVASHCAQHIVHTVCYDAPTPSDDLHNVLSTDRSEVVLDENNITVRGILEKSRTKAPTFL